MKNFSLTLICLSALTFASAQPSDAVFSPEKALAFANSNAQLLGLNPEDVAESKVSDFYTDKSTGLTHAYFQQFYKGKPVFNGILGLHFNRKQELVHHNVNFVKVANVSFLGNSPLANFEHLLSNASTAVGVSLDFATFNSIVLGNKNQYFLENQSYYYTCLYNQENTLHEAVNFIFFDLPSGNWWNIIVNTSGEVLEKVNWTTNCSHNLKNRHATHGAGDTAKLHAFKFTVESPLHGSRSVLLNPQDTVASPFGWFDTDGISGHETTLTRGNNALAAEDQNANNVADYSPNGGTDLEFDFPYNPNEFDPLNYTDFAITNLFVANNLLHDILYHYGFDEKSGNFQFNNYSKGGLGSDEVNADAQDGSGSNNANFSTPPDGSNPRMQMFIWDATAQGGATLKINSPQKSQFKVGKAQFGPALTTTPITANIIYVNDGVGNGMKGCKSLKNGSQLAGKIAAIERGDCLFVEKVIAAQNAGAIAAVILDTSSADVLISMSGTNASITIPSVFVKLSNAGELQELLLGGAVNISLYDSSGTQPKTDSDLDLGVIAHEYGHGVSNRLTCGPSNTSALNNAEQMGEGWSDYLGLALTVKDGDIGTTPRGIGNWLIGEDLSGGGIRTYPYSTNMAINPHTYGNIKKQAVSGKTEVHYLGEVWCVMLWDLHWKMVAKYGYDKDLYNGTGGNNKTLKIVLEGMKLQKCSPGFVDGRDAILKADSLINSGANSKLIWEVFARRGLGFSAKQGSSASTSDGTEAFDLHPALINSIESYAYNIASLRPNPASEVVIVEPLLSNSIDKVELFDTKGQKFNIKIQTGVAGSMILNLQGLVQGIYFINISAGNNHQVLKLQKL